MLKHGKQSKSPKVKKAMARKGPPSLADVGHKKSPVGGIPKY